LTFVAAAGNAARLAVNPPTSSIDVAGSVALGNATLDLQNVGGRMTAGAVLTLISNDGVDPIAGTLMGLPEGSVVNSGGQSFRVSYFGGSGNDVTLTVLAGQAYDSTTSVTSSNTLPRSGETVVLTATVSAPLGGSPQGGVSFYDGGVLLGTSTIGPSGKATLAASFPPGVHTVTAAYSGFGTFASSAGTLRQNVLPLRSRAAR
jgi:hypothetical protein